MFLILDFIDILFCFIIDNLVEHGSILFLSHGCFTLEFWMSCRKITTLSWLCSLGPPFLHVHWLLTLPNYHELLLTWMLVNRSLKSFNNGCLWHPYHIRVKTMLWHKLFPIILNNGLLLELDKHSVSIRYLKLLMRVPCPRIDSQVHYLAAWTIFSCMLPILPLKHRLPFNICTLRW